MGLKESFSFLSILVVVVVIFLFRHFGDVQRLPWQITTGVVFGWLLSLVVVVLFPLDLVESRKGAQQDALVGVWKGFYWSTFLLTWLFLPMMQSFFLHGEFKFLPRLWGAFVENVKFYAICGAVLLLALILVAATGGMEDIGLLPLAMASSDAWGLALLMGLMGYGMVHIPRALWEAGNSKKLLEKVYKEAPHQHHRWMDAQVELSNVKRRIARWSATSTRHQDLVQLLLQKMGTLPKERSTESDTTIDGCTHDDIVEAHAQLLSSLDVLGRERSGWEGLLAQARFLQDMIYNAEMGLPTYWIWKHSNPTTYPMWIRQLIWRWRIQLREYVLMGSAVGCALLSLLIVWSQLVSPISSINLSLFALVPKMVGDGSVFFWTSILLAYCAACGLIALFRLKLFGYYRLGKNSDGNSLLFSASYACRLGVPLGWFVQSSLVRTHNTAFAHVIGEARMVPVLGASWAFWIPLLCLLVMLATLKSVWTSVKWCKGEEWLNLLDDEMDEEEGEEGRRLVEQELEREDRRRQTK